MRPSDKSTQYCQFSKHENLTHTPRETINKLIKFHYDAFTFLELKLVEI